MSSTISTATIPSAKMRLTMRGRRVLAGMILAASVVAGVAGWSATANASNQATSPASYVQVHSGQTLWQIARTAAPGRDTRDVVTELMTANHLQNATVQPGTRLLVPSDL